ncbi:MAG TPA: DUF4062 domain-containing protein [Vicinamibacterales bacterium]|jgi:hypothetical protein
MSDSVASAHLQDFQIYLSSTLEDLREERIAAIDVLRHYGRVIDSYRADPHPTPENCIADVRASQLFVLILGMRYGWVPGGESDPTAKSITEMEYDACRTDAIATIPRLVFQRTTNQKKFTDDETNPDTAERGRRFRKRAATDQQAFEFDSIGQFREMLRDAVTRVRVIPSPIGPASLRAAPWVLGQTVRSLPGYPVLGDAAHPVLAGGAIVHLILSHNHASRHGIVIISLKPEWTHHPLRQDQPRYQIDPSVLPPQGFFSPERFTLVLAGRAIKDAFWPRSKDHGPIKALDDDLLHTNPPRQIQLDDQTGDTVSVEGVVRLKTPGCYSLRWCISYTVAGTSRAIKTDPLEFVCNE